MSDSNQKTIDAYNAHVKEYVEGTAQAIPESTARWIDDGLEGLPKGASILELGSGFGRDANYIESKGFTVRRTDGSVSFVELLRRQGYDAEVLNILADNLGEKHDLIFANAVLLHLTTDEFGEVCHKVYAALKSGGRFMLSVKKGDGEEWTEAKLGVPRYFHYWQSEDVVDYLYQAGFKNVACRVAPHYRPDDHDFIFLTAVKDGETEDSV